MRFRPEPRRPEGAPRREGPLWRWILFAAATTVAVCATLPWLQVRFARLLGDHFGPPGWHSPTGFTCLLTALFVAVMALAETQSPSSRLAARPGSFLLVGVAAVTLLLDWYEGPGSLRGVTAAWTAWFYLSSVSLPLLLIACAQRWAVASPGQR
jgi:hypothetical protein